MLDLSQPGERKRVARRILSDIDAWAVKEYDDGPRAHLGASILGHACARYCWYTFRWVKYFQHTGRMLRLFQRGHKEELRFIEYLRGIGFAVTDRDEQGNQFRISFADGHGGGSLDGIATPPQRYGLPGRVLTEYKTNGTGKSFGDLCANGVALAKPQHYAQMSLYGYKMGLRVGVYMNVNKNDDDMHVEVVELDWRLGASLEEKAARIIAAQTAPERLSSSPAYSACKFCDYKEVCHSSANVVLDRNCRSCCNARAVSAGQWFCAHYNANIPKEYIPNACGSWTGIA